MPLYGGFQLGAFQDDFQTTLGSSIGLYTSDAEFIDALHRDWSTFCFPQLGPTEKRILTFDFSEDLALGEQLAGNIAVSVADQYGRDASPGSIIGEPSFNVGLTQALFPVSGLNQDSEYYFVVTCDTSNGSKTLARYALLAVKG